MPATAVTVIHKFIRREMFDFSERLFRAGPEDVAAIRRALDEVTGLLHGHAAHEDSRFEPLLRQLDAALAERMVRDHRRLDDELESLRHAASKLDPLAASCVDGLLQLHLDWNRFVSGYLAHLDDEERTLFPRLGGQLPPPAAVVESTRSQGPGLGSEFLLRLWSVTTCTERTAIEQAQQRA